MTQELTQLSLDEALKGLQKKTFSCRDLTQAHIKRMDAIKPLNAYVTVTSDLAMDQARQSDERYAAGTARPLEGVPLAIKDLFCTKNILTTACSKILSNFVPAYESTITQRLWDAGAVCLGKTNMDEFAMGSANMHSYFGSALNPYVQADSRKAMVPGGSSGGSAAAVAAGAALAATGSDTGGSIRQPAAFCGLVGIKPTYGLCSRFGMVAFASSFDQAGPLTRTVQDAIHMLSAMVGYDPKDATSLKQADGKDFGAFWGHSIKGIKVGLLPEDILQGVDPDILKAYEETKTLLRHLGAELVPVKMPHIEKSLAVYYILAPAEASSNLARYDGVRYGRRVQGETLEEMYEATRGEGFGFEVKRRILTGTYVLSAGYYDAYYLKAQKVRRLITEDFHNAFQKVDMVLTPTTPTPAFAQASAPKDPITMYLNDVLTVPANIAGLPGLSMPVGLTSKNLPIGMQLLGPAFSEARLFQVAGALEKEISFDQKRDLMTSYLASTGDKNGL